MRLTEIRGSLRRGREEQRRLLTRPERVRPERVVAWVVALLHSLCCFVGVVLLAGARVLQGSVLPVLALLVMSVPISPFLKARVRRREARAEHER
jgi:hypothetical protein